jgi:hypothetical protein
VLGILITNLKILSLIHLKTSGYDLSDFGLVEYYRHKYRRNDSNFVDRYSLNF